MIKVVLQIFYWLVQMTNVVCCDRLIHNGGTLGTWGPPHCPAFLCSRISLDIFFCRSSSSDFLVAGGPTKTWIVGNSLVTITTSTMGEGLCKRCSLNRMGDGKDDASLHSIGDVSSAYRGTGELTGVCSCRSSGWAEIKIRRPSGNTGWMMHLQNRPHPLSLMQPSAHSIPDSDIGLLSASLPVAKLATIGEALAGENEDIFFSREVGSYTDISFLSSISAHFTGVRGEGDQACKEDGRESMPVGDSQQPAKEMEDAESGKIEEGERSAEKDKGFLEPSKVGCLGVREVTSVRESSREDVGEEVGERKVDAVAVDEDEELDVASLLDLKDADIVHKENHRSELEVNSINTDDSKSPSMLTLFPDYEVSSTQTKHSPHSQSWSENAGSTTPLFISSAPRASSYSFSMFPPLFSYDEEEEFSRSLPLHQGAVVMSDEEQVYTKQTTFCLRR